MRLAAILISLCVASASAQELRDSGYGDGSLMDQDGNYYIPQPDGSFVDAYGDTLTPDAPGELVDPLGNVLELSPDSDAFAGTRWRSASGEGESGSEGRDQPLTSTATTSLPPDDAGSSIAEAVRKGIYMDVGTGYMELDSPQYEYRPLDWATAAKAHDDKGPWDSADLPLTGAYPPGPAEQQEQFNGPDSAPSIDDAPDQGLRQAPLSPARFSGH